MRNDDVNNLLNMVSALAREEHAQLRDVPEDVIPSLSDHQRERLADLILRAQALERQEDSPQGDASLLAVDSLARAREARKRCKAATTIACGVGGVLLVAAALVLWLRPPTDKATPLPGFTISASGGVVELRGGSADTLHPEAVIADRQRVRADTELRIECRPDSAIAGPIAARTFFVQGGVAEEIRPRVEVAPSGAVAIRVHGGDLINRHRGSADLRILVGRPDAIRDIAARSADRTAGPSATGDLHWLTAPVDLDSN